MGMYGIIGCGWLGRLIAEELLLQGKKCYVSNRSGNALWDERIQVYKYALPEDDLPTVFNTCGRLFVCISPGRNRIAFPGVIHQLCLSLRHLPLDTKVVFCSSISVYSRSGICHEQTPVKEDDPLLLAEKKIQSLAQPVLLLRLGGLYGEGRHPAHFFKGNLAGGAGTFTNLIEGKTAVKAMLHLLNKNETGIFNLVETTHEKKEIFYGRLREKEKLPLVLFSETEKEGKVISAGRLLKTGFDPGSGLFF